MGNGREAEKEEGRFAKKGSFGKGEIAGGHCGATGGIAYGAAGSRIAKSDDRCGRRRVGDEYPKKNWRQAIMRVVQSRGRGILSRLCILSGHSRWGYYKGVKQQSAKELQGAIVAQKIEAHRKLQPQLGGRRLQVVLTPFLTQQQIKMGRDSIFDVMRMYGLLLACKRRNKPRTTFSNHGLKKYPNQVANLTPISPNGVWVSDITYIELSKGHAYLSLVTDAYSRKIVGYHLNERLDASGPIKALQIAIQGCKDPRGLIHHSDRGVQYCCNDYVRMLEKEQISISMTQSGDPRDNAIAERVNGILKMELLQESYADVYTARAAIDKAVNTYNYLRPHSSIGMLTPTLAHLTRGELKRYWKNYYKIKPKDPIEDSSEQAA